MKTHLFRSTSLIAAFALTACAALIPSQYSVPKAKLVSKLQQTFPLQREVGKGLFSVRMNTPVLNLLVDKNRVELVGDIAAHSLLMETVTGQFTLSGALRYDRDERAIYIQDAQLDALQISTDPAAAEMLRPLPQRDAARVSQQHAAVSFSNRRTSFCRSGNRHYGHSDSIQRLAA